MKVLIDYANSIAPEGAQYYNCKLKTFIRYEDGFTFAWDGHCWDKGTSENINDVWQDHYIELIETPTLVAELKDCAHRIIQRIERQRQFNHLTDAGEALNSCKEPLKNLLQKLQYER